MKKIFLLFSCLFFIACENFPNAPHTYPSENGVVKIGDKTCILHVVHRNSDPNTLLLYYLDCPNGYATAQPAGKSMIYSSGSKSEPIECNQSCPIKGETNE
jgi:hypothetical protein